jgi:energy-coupling factor transport system ATP-binding protein
MHAACERDRYAYVGPEVYHSLSGLTGSVQAELALNAFGGQAQVNSFSSQVGLTPFLERSAFELSGGQQVLLAVAAGTLLRPRVLSLDCCLEQLDTSRRDALLGAISEFSEEMSIAVADNEMDGLPVLARGTTVMIRPPGGREPFPSMSAATCKECLPPRRDAPALDFRAIRFDYGRSAPVLRGLEMELVPERVYWLRGENGSGKSTLAKILAGVLKLTTGEIHAAGKPIYPAQSPGFLASYHFQNPDFQLFSTTVWNEVIAGPQATGCLAVDAVERCRRALALLAIPETLHHSHPLDLPFALRKRLAVAAAIASGVPWLILDEPTLGQDAHNTFAMATLIRALARAGTGVIVISHSNHLMGGIADMTLDLKDGQVEITPLRSVLSETVDSNNLNENQPD